MEPLVHLDVIYIPSEDVVAREIEGELIIVPLVAGVSDIEDELFTLNDTGKAIWDMLDGERSLKVIIETLTDEFDVAASEMENDVVGFMKELIKRRMVTEYFKD